MSSIDFLFYVYLNPEEDDWHFVLEPNPTPYKNSAGTEEVGTSVMEDEFYNVGPEFFLNDYEKMTKGYYEVTGTQSCWQDYWGEWDSELLVETRPVSGEEMNQILAKHINWDDIYADISPKDLEVLKYETFAISKGEPPMSLHFIMEMYDEVGDVASFVVETGYTHALNIYDYARDCYCIKISLGKTHKVIGQKPQRLVDMEKEEIF